MHRMHGLGCPVSRAGLLPLATLGLLSLSLPTLASDATLRARVERRLELAGVPVEHVEVLTLDGNVVLDGVVPSWIAWRQAGRAARHEAGRVINRLRVAPRSR